MTPESKQDTTLGIKIQRGLFDLDSMSDVTLVKTGTFVPVKTVDEAQHRLNHESAKLLEVINVGLRALAQSSLAKNSEVDWMVENEDGELTRFEGTPISGDVGKALNASVLNQAKLMVDWKNASLEEKREAKEQVRNMIIQNPVMIEAIKKRATTNPGPEDE